MAGSHGRYGWSSRLPWGWAALSLILLSGCVERRLRIRTAPEGATVYVNGRYAGETPVDHFFDHYGTYQLDLWMSGHESLSTEVEVEAPWWQIPPFDFFAELFDPRRKVDEHTVELVLDPKTSGREPGQNTDLIPPDEEAKQRGREMQARAKELRGSRR